MTGPGSTSHLFDVDDRVTLVHRGEMLRGIVAGYDLPADGIPGYVPGPRDRKRIVRATSYSGAICREHQRPAPPYEGAPHIAMTRPHYDVICGSHHLHVCECVIVEAPAPTLFEVES